MGPREITLSLVASAALLGACKKAPAPGAKGPLLVAAASDLRKVAPELGRAFKAQTGTEVTFTFGASGMLAKQLEQGAPFGVFLSASEPFARAATTTGRCDAQSLRIYAEGTLSLYAPPGKSMPAEMGDLVLPSFARIAIANPDHAPYGKAAKAALTKAGLWEKVLPRIVFAESVDQALSFATSGNADVAFVSRALVQEGPGTSRSVPSDLYEPLRQAAVVCGSDAAAKAFLDFVMSPAGRTVLSHAGFGAP